MKFTCRPVGLEFIEGAAWRFENVVELDAPPEAVFDIFADGESWPRWFDGIKRVVWTSPEPKGVGTTRTVTLTTMTVHEHFLAWDRGRRFAFRFEASSLPLCRAGIEDYRLEALADGRTRFFYGVYLEPTLVARFVGPLARAQFTSMFRRAAEGLRGYVAAARRKQEAAKQPTAKIPQKLIGTWALVAGRIDDGDFALGQGGATKVFGEWTITSNLVKSSIGTYDLSKVEEDGGLIVASTPGRAVEYLFIPRFEEAPVVFFVAYIKGTERMRGLLVPAQGEQLKSDRDWLAELRAREADARDLFKAKSQEPGFVLESDRERLTFEFPDHEG